MIFNWPIIKLSNPIENSTSQNIIRPASSSITDNQIIQSDNDADSSKGINLDDSFKISKKLTLDEELFDIYTKNKSLNIHTIEQ